MKFCRNCSQPLLEKAASGPTDSSWTSAARGAGGWRAEAESPPEVVLDLAQLPVFVEPRAMMEMRFLNGLLAVQQAGGFAALVHPFRVSSEAGHLQSALLWTEAERAEVSCPTNVRPYAPLLTPDQRHIVFSHSHAVYALHMWSLPGWVRPNDDASRHRLIVNASKPQGLRVAAAPVALSESTCGVLLRGEDGEYFWTVAGLDGDAPQPVDGFDSSRRVRLPIQGAACQVFDVGGKVVAIATSQEHWVWRISDAGELKVDALRRTWPNPKEPAAKLMLDSEAANPHEHRFGRQFIDFSRGSDGRLPERFNWYFTTGERRRHELHTYYVDVSTLEPSLGRLLDNKVGYLPLGAHRNPAAPVAFVGETRLGRLVGGEVESWPGIGLIENTNEASGLIFSDPLFIIVRGVRDSGPRQLAVHSLLAPGHNHTVQVDPLCSEPLTWAKWLFTHEARSSDGGDKSLIVRRELPLS